MKRLVLLTVLLLALVPGYSQTIQTITGRIYDEASGAPVEGATILVTDTDPLRGANADSGGFFRIDSVPIGRHTFKITYVPYEPKMLYDIDVTAGKQVNLNIPLQEAIKTLKEVTISYDKTKDKNKTVNDMIQVSGRSFNVDETKRY
ncbi:MAG: carboxypeptidase regulatory-like domain-containing protein, partial [Chitinophagia bacterium]|nr:carboxypeptidase regulatory-like domain-containing protein [Chitinophagia bacterium]